jgi:hypothetical protein
MAATSEVEIGEASDRLNAELCRQLALGNDTVHLGVLARETGLTERRVEEVMGKFEQQLGSPVRRTGNGGRGVEWRLREGE